MTTYVYHFNDDLDRFSELFENRLGDRSGYHEQEFFDVLELVLALKRGGACIDVGAGMGRITARARELMTETVALEPDESRWRECHRACNSEPECLVLCQTTSEYLRDNPDRQFDLAVVSMVLQHVSSENCIHILGDIAKLLKPGGVAIVSTTHTLEACKGYSFTGDNNRVYVPEAEFNAYTQSPPAQQNLGLPVRRFSKQDFMDAVEPFLSPIYWGQTSFYRPVGLNFFSKRLQVAPEELENIGNTQFVVAQKCD
ncbi:MAG: class I SAM-dependent methyltransferase [Halioglobus sp.]